MVYVTNRTQWARALKKAKDHNLRPVRVTSGVYAGQDSYAIQEEYRVPSRDGQSQHTVTLILSPSKDPLVQCDCKGALYGHPCLHAAAVLDETLFREWDALEGVNARIREA